MNNFYYQHKKDLIQSYKTTNYMYGYNYWDFHYGINQEMEDFCCLPYYTKLRMSKGFNCISNNRFWLEGEMDRIFGNSVYGKMVISFNKRM